MARLDRNRSFGVVYGSGLGHSFEQDGRCFDQDGEEVGQPRQKADKPAKHKAEDAPTPHDAELEAQLKG